MKLKTVIDEVRHEVDVLKGEDTRHRTYSSQRTFPDEAAARDGFARSKEKLFRVNGWSDLSIFTANFTLHDQTGTQRVDRQPQVGDYILIELPGPMPENWVRVIHVADEDQSAEFTVKPSPNPQRPDKVTEEVTHFFQAQARSTFRIERTNTIITAYEIGRDEAINNQDAQAGDRALINTLIAEVGWLFQQPIQWKTLTDYLVHLDK